MKIDLGNISATLLASLATTNFGTPQTISQSSTAVTTRTPIIGHPELAAEDVAITGKVEQIGETWTSVVDTLIFKDGHRVTMVSASDFSYYHLTISGQDFVDWLAGVSLGLDTKGSYVEAVLGGNDTLNGNNLANFFYAGAGNDRISGGSGADRIDGGIGTDTSVYREVGHADYLVSRLSNGTVTVATKDGVTDTNVAVENFEFDDGLVAASALRYLPGYTEPPATGTGLVYRFYNARDKAFFYTNSVVERDMIIRESTDAAFNPDNGVWPYFYQGATFEQAHSSAGSTAVYRFYNTETGHHFFTTSAGERDMVQKESTDPSYGQPGLWPYKYEGVAFNAFADGNHPDAVAVQRFYSAELNRHFYTANVQEANEIKLTGQWVSEGIGYWAEAPG